LKNWEECLSFDEDQPNIKRNHANNPLEVTIGPIDLRKKKLKKALNELVSEHMEQDGPRGA
jgi:DnaJ-domain-containing protein 1